MKKVESYQKKPVNIQAIQFDENNGQYIEDWINSQSEGAASFHISAASTIGSEFVTRLIFITTLGGEMRADIGDFIIRGIKGEFYPCKPGIFESWYIEIAEQESPISQ